MSPELSSSAEYVENFQERDKMLVEIGTLVSNNLETILSVKIIHAIIVTTVHAMSLFIGFLQHFYFQVLKSVWSIISENMSVALSSFSALIQLLFTGSSALFNLVSHCSSSYSNKWNVFSFLLRLYSSLHCFTC